MNRLAAALFLLVALGCGGAPPPPDRFSTAPAHVRSRRPGDLIRAEKLAGSPPGSLAWKVLYASTGLDGRLIEVSGIVIAPTDAPPISVRPVVAWAHPTTGVAENCAPSNWKGVFDTIPHLSALMALDYVVAATDYPGLGTAGPHPYLVGESEGRAVLDSVRAAARVGKSGAGTRFAVWGHSQGGQAVLFAGQLAKDYAPELSLVGVAAIAPVTDLTQLLRDDLDERVGKILVAYCLWSWSRVYGISLDPWVAPGARATIDRVAADCVESEGEGYPASLPLASGFLSPEAYTSGPLARRLDENRPGQAPAGAPLYVAQGTDDLIVRPSLTADFVAGLCRSGEIVRFERLEGTGHLKAGRVSASSAIRWMRDRFEGARTPNTCPPF